MTDKTTDTARTAGSADMTEQTIIDDTIISPGSLTRALATCRAGADMDIKQAAGEMRLPLGVLKALEAEEFDNLPEPPYIRGYLRSYARLNESDPNELIRRYEILRGADPNDVPAFAPATPLQRTTNKPAVSPSTVKLAGLALMVLVLGVLSMIPAVSQWASETWRSFSEPAAEQQLASADGATESAQQNGTGSNNTNDTAIDNNNQANSGNSASSSNDTAAPSGDSEQLAPNNQDNDSSSTGNSNDASNTNTAQQSSGSDNNDNPSGNASDGDNNEAEKNPTQTATTDSTSDGSNDGTNTAAEENPESTEAIAAKLAEEEKAKKLAEEEAARKKAEEEEAKKLAEAEAAKKKAEEEEAKKLAEEEAAKKKLEEEEKAKKLAETEAAKKKAEKEKKDNFKQPMEGNVAIRLVFSSNVWMSIKDAKGKNIFAALSGPGNRRNLTARTPLNFRVGNAPGVKIYLNGQLVDQRPYTKGSVSQFSVN